ncbi:MAG: hypothetical protein ACRCVX_11250 [Shewanella sp.]
MTGYLKAHFCECALRYSKGIAVFGTIKMKDKDELRNQMVLLSLQIENCKCPNTKTRLLNRARALIASSKKSNTNEARARITRLQDAIPLVYQRNPHGLTIIEERQPGYEKLLPFRMELEKGKRMKDQIEKIATQFNIEVPRGAKPKTKGNPNVRRSAKDKRIMGARSLEYSQNKFRRLDSLNKTIDDSDESKDVRNQSASGKKSYISRETEFNGSRRNDKQSNTRQSWNPEAKKLASAKGAK